MLKEVLFYFLNNKLHTKGLVDKVINIHGGIDKSIKAQNKKWNLFLGNLIS